MSHDGRHCDESIRREYIVWWEVVSVERVAVPVVACCPARAAAKSEALIELHRTLRDGAPETNTSRLRRVEAQ